MLFFFDESFRSHLSTGREFGALCGVSIPESSYHQFQRDFFLVRRPYHDTVLQAEHEIKGRELLGKATRKTLDMKGFSYHWNLASELLQFAARFGVRVFGVVCFRPNLKSFVCGDANRLDATFRDVFDRMDTYMKAEYPQRMAKLIFYSRDHDTHEKNSRAITNFFVKSTLGLGYDNILKVPLFAVSQGHNYGLQLADLVTTVIAIRFQGEHWIDPLWHTVQSMVYFNKSGPKPISSLRVMREK